MPQDSIEKREAVHGKKMIEVRVRFWTNDIVPDKNIRPGHAWTSGVVRVSANADHGIKAGRPQPFHTLMDIGAVIEKALISSDIHLHPSRRMRKYVSDLETSDER
jgi:hypothetical protein